MSLRPIAIAFALALAAGASFAQQAPTPAPAEAASAAQDCAKRHDHGAERQAPAARSGCKPVAKKAAKASRNKDAAMQGHDHGKMHKMQ